jgi:hypothetical protein
MLTGFETLCSGYPPPPRAPEGRRGAMSEGVFSFFRDLSGLMLLFVFVTGAWAFLIMGILAALNAWFGIELPARWKKRT